MKFKLKVYKPLAIEVPIMVNILKVNLYNFASITLTPFLQLVKASLISP
jgi:hypothetical protein